MINLQLDGIFSVFETRIPNDLDFKNDTDSVILTPEGKTWNPYCKYYANNESTFTDEKGDLVPSEYVHIELIDQNDLDHDTLEFSDLNAFLAACEELNAPSKLSTAEVQVASDVADSSLVYWDMKAHPEWYGIPTSQDEVRTKLTSVNAALDPILFADAVHNEAAIFKFKMSIRSTSALPPDDTDDLRCDEPVSFEVDLNNLKSLLSDLEDLYYVMEVLVLLVAIQREFHQNT